MRFCKSHCSFCLSTSFKTIGDLSKAPKSLSRGNTGWFALKNGLRNSIRPDGDPQFIKNIEKHMRRPMMPSWCTMWPPESNLILKIVDSMSNESPSKVLQDAHAYYWPQWPFCRRIPVFSSIHAAAVRIWPSKSATPSKAYWSQFESVNNDWYLKRKP